MRTGILKFKDNRVNLAQALYEGHRLSIHWTKDDSEHFLVFNGEGFKRVFDYACGYTQKYTDVSFLPMQTKFQSVCRPTPGQPTNSEIECKFSEHIVVNNDSEQQRFSLREQIRDLFKTLDGLQNSNDKHYVITILSAEARGDINKLPTAIKEIIEIRKAELLASVIEFNLMHLAIDIPGLEEPVYLHYLGDE